MDKTPNKIQDLAHLRQDKLDPLTEEIAFKYLLGRRARPIWDGHKTPSTIATNFLPEQGSKNTKALFNLQNRWQEIIGEKLSSITKPESINGKTLTIRTNASASTLIQMRQDEILGASMLATGIKFEKLRLVHAPIKRNINKTIAPLSASQKANIDKRLENIEHEGLKDALRLLETYIQNSNR